jgi:hypothetical protein
VKVKGSWSYLRAVVLKPWLGFWIAGVVMGIVYAAGAPSLNRSLIQGWESTNLNLDRKQLNQKCSIPHIYRVKSTRAFRAFS